jgi:hypothetical protein
MKKLFFNKPKRLFTFGCSFTNYSWLTWADILAHELDCEYYNFGQAGSGNVYISNMVCQADQHFNFNEEDLVIVCWSGIQREDRYKADRWFNAGNIYYNDNKLWSVRFAKVIADDCHFLMRDLATIKLIHNLLKDKTQFHFLAMDTIKKSKGLKMNRTSFHKLFKLYNNIFDYIEPSFEEVLWGGSSWNRISVHKHYTDNHPTPGEHFEYLTKVFDYKFSDETKSKIVKLNTMYLNLIGNVYSKIKFDVHPADDNFPKDLKILVETGYKAIKIAESLPIPPNIIN